MKALMTISAGTATFVCLLAALMCAIGFGTPNVGDGTLLEFWVTLWGVTFAGVFGGIMIPCTIGCILRRVTA